MVKCYHCGNLGYLRKTVVSVPALNKVYISVGKHSEGECDTLVVEHVLLAGVMGNWIVNSGATCHVCHDERLFFELQPLEKETDIYI